LPTVKVALLALVIDGALGPEAPRTSTAAMSHSSEVGDVSFSATAVPDAAVGLVVDWVQNAPPSWRLWSWRVWFAPTVRPVPVSQSKPTANTQELALLVVTVTVGAPLPAWLVAKFPTPAELENATTNSSTLAACASWALIAAPVSGVLALATQTSAVPGWVS